MPKRPGRLATALLAAVLLVVAPACSGDDDDDGAGPDGGTSSTVNAKSDFQAAVDDALKTFAQALTEAIPSIQSWREGKTDKATVTLSIDRVAAEAGKVVLALDDVKAGNGKERTAKGLYTASAYLYREMAALTKEAVNSTDPALGQQLDRSGLRVRVLADRVYDRGRLTLDPRYFDPGGDAVQINRPPDVPDWAAEGNAPGPPLDDEVAPPDGYPERSAFRSKGPEDKWVKAVEAADVPTAAELAAAVHATDPMALRDAARRIQAAVKDLDDVPDPDEDRGRERAATVRLGLLVSAEAARAAQAALLVPAGQKPSLVAVADRLLFIGGDLLWDDALPNRRSGLDDSVLDVPVVEVQIPSTSTSPTAAPPG